MATWGGFEFEAPDLAARGRAVLTRTGVGRAQLATVRGEGLPRIHPINVEIVGGRLLVFLIEGSAKVADLTTDGRYALSSLMDLEEPHEFLVRGRATEVRDPAVRAAAVGGWAFEVDDTFRLFELGIDHVVFGDRPTDDDWPPVYASWRPTGTG